MMDEEPAGSRRYEMRRYEIWARFGSLIGPAFGRGLEVRLALLPAAAEGLVELDE